MVSSSSFLPVPISDRSLLRSDRTALPSRAGNHDPETGHLLCAPTLGGAWVIPPGHIAFFPSALVPHYNLHASDYQPVEGETRGSVIGWWHGAMGLSLECGRTQADAGKEVLVSKWGLDTYNQVA